MRFSQEKVADLSGLSLRTVQRLEAGHRVSYASLRALAVAFKTDADILEREFYAVSKSADEFVEIPRWIRLASDRLWFGGPRLSRRDALGIEALCIVCTVIAFASSFWVSDHAKVPTVRLGATVALFCGYLTAMSIRNFDQYKLWPGSENSPPETLRTWKGAIAGYAFLIAAGILGAVTAAWLIA